MVSGIFKPNVRTTITSGWHRRYSYHESRLRFPKYTYCEYLNHQTGYEPSSIYDTIHDSDVPVWLACNSGRSAKHFNTLVSMYLYITCLCITRRRDK